MPDSILLEPGVEIRCAVSGCGRWHVVYTQESRPVAALSGPGLFLWTRCGDGLVFVGAWGTASRHPIRRPVSAGPEEPASMAMTPDFTAMAARLIGGSGDPALGARIAEELRLTWNARGAADIAKLEAEIPSVCELAPVF